MPMGLSRSDFESLGFENSSSYAPKSIAQLQSPVKELGKSAATTTTTTTTAIATTTEKTKKRPAPLSAAFTTPMPIDETPSSTSTPSFPFNLQLPFFSNTNTNNATTTTNNAPKTPSHLPFSTPIHPFSHHHTPPSSISPPRQQPPSSRIPNLNLSIPLPSFLASLASTVTPATQNPPALPKEDDWTPANDSALVNLIISKLALSPAQLKECASALGKEPSDVQGRWGELVDRQVVGVLPGRFSPKRSREVADEGYFGGVEPERDVKREMRERRFRRAARGVGGRSGILEEWKELSLS